MAELVIHDTELQSWSGRWSVNCSTVFGAIPPLDRAAAARDTGHSAVEFWWPFASSSPQLREVDAFLGSIEAAGLALDAMNLFAGDMTNGERGVLCHPDRRSEFQASIAVARDIAAATGCRRFNALYGLRSDHRDPTRENRCAIDNLTEAAQLLAEVDGGLLLEPLSGAERYPLITAQDAVNVADTVNDLVGFTAARLLLDLYHLAANGEDLDRVISVHGPAIGHVQVADHPGRHEPGTGDLPIADLLRAIDGTGYTGRIGLEYFPSHAAEHPSSTARQREGV